MPSSGGAAGGRSRMPRRNRSACGSIPTWSRSSVRRGLDGSPGSMPCCAKHWGLRRRGTALPDRHVADCHPR